MSAPKKVQACPFFLDGSRGKLFAIYFQPEAPYHSLGDILLAPPFAEEMNRCRAMVSMQARALAQFGIGTLILDPYGTGDSGGQFQDADWDLWCDDLRRSVAWLHDHGNGCRTVWGIRLGAIMAAELAGQCSEIDRLLFWQPVIQGRAFFTQFLRVQIAAELHDPNGVKTTDELRRQSAAGEIIEISGYRISPALARTVDTVHLPAPSRIPSTRLAWFEVLPNEDTAIPRNNGKIIEEYREGGMDLRLTTVIGPAFWQLHERVLAPDLIDATTKEVSAWME